MSEYETYHGDVYYNGTDLSYINWSQVTGVEWFVIACLAFSTVLCLITIILLVIKRNYPPVKAKQVPLQIVCGISAILCQVGMVTFAKLVPQHGVFLLDGGCYGFGVWMTHVFGGMLFADTLIFALLRLYFIFNLRRMPTTIQQVLIFLCMWLYPFLFGVTLTALKLNGPEISSSSGEPSCYFAYSATYALLVYFALIIVAFVYLAVALRKIPRKAFAEYQTNRNLFIFFLIIYILMIVVIAVVGSSIAGRVVGVLLILLALDVTFFCRVAVPLYHSLVDPEEYKAVFYDKINNSSEIKAAATKMDSATTRKSKRTAATVSSSTIEISSLSSKGNNSTTAAENEDKGTEIEHTTETDIKIAAV